jgi:hypothetical protein
MCVLAAMIGVTYRGLDRNILVEIGLVVLVGLAAKNASLSSSLPDRRRSKERHDLKPPDTILPHSLAFCGVKVPVLSKPSIDTFDQAVEQRQAHGCAKHLRRIQRWSAPFPGRRPARPECQVRLKETALLNAISTRPANKSCAWSCPRSGCTSIGLTKLHEVDLELMIHG